MKKNSRYATAGLLVTVFWCWIAVTYVQAGDYAALNGVKSIKAVFDIRAGNPTGTMRALKLVHQTFKDKNVLAISPKPEVVVVLIGPAVKLVSKDRKGFSAAEEKSLNDLAATVSEMAKDGFKFELCEVAARAFGVDPASVLPEIQVVGNGWISLIGYQSQGYALVAIY